MHIRPFFTLQGGRVMLRVYLDNCCYNRPFDSQKNAVIVRETQAKLFIQSLIRYNSAELVYSAVSLREIADSPFERNSRAILDFIEENARYYVASDRIRAAGSLIREITRTGVKQKDAAHVACAILAGCHYLLSTDRRLLKYVDSRIKLVNPIDFVRIWEERQ